MPPATSMLDYTGFRQARGIAPLAGRVTRTVRVEVTPSKRPPASGTQTREVAVPHVGHFHSTEARKGPAHTADNNLRASHRHPH
jgi:hypothetical protein